FVYGVEMDPLVLRVATIASQKVEGDGQFVPVLMECTPKTVRKLPEVDTVICLSIWHHWVRHLGLESASEILRVLWSRARGALFFDTGEGEMPIYYNLPFSADNSAQWLHAYLSEL